MSRGANFTLKAVRRHHRLWIALALGLITYLLLPKNWSVVSRLLVAWDVGVAAFLIAIYFWMSKLSGEQLSSRCIEEDPSAPLILVAVTAASLLSLVAIVELLATLAHVNAHQRVWHFMLAAATLIGSWLLVPTMFTTHYADMFYSASRQQRPLSFPETETPVFWDFAYFSFTIAAACQTADVLTTRPGIRKVVIAHEIVSFAFNASILGFAINVIAGLIGSAG